MTLDITVQADEELDAALKVDGKENWIITINDRGNVFDFEVELGSDLLEGSFGWIFKSIADVGKEAKDAMILAIEEERSFTFNGVEIPHEDTLSAAEYWEFIPHEQLRSRKWKTVFE